MAKIKNKHMNMTVPMDLFNDFRNLSIEANKSIAEMLREFMRASIEGRVTIDRTFTDYERKLYKLS